MKTTVLLCLSALMTCAIARAEDHVVKQDDRTFSVTEITIKPGEALIFTNCDSVTHNVFSHSQANPFTIKVQKPGEATTVAFKEEGVTEVRCAIHPKMKILVTVKQ